MTIITASEICAGEDYSLLGKSRNYLSHCTDHEHRLPMCITEFIGNVEEAAQSQYRRQCVLHDGFVTFFLISLACFIKKRGKTPVGAVTIA